MGALPRPDLAPGAHHDLVGALHELHHRAGWPSLRALAREAGCSHTTVSTVFSSPRLPSWGVLELLVEAMDGDVRGFREMWHAASSPDGPEVSTAPLMAGRKAELSVVRRHVEGGRGLLLVTGEAGIGKTRLATTAAARASDRVFTAVGSCLPLSTEEPLLPVADVLRSVYEVDRGDWLREALAEQAPYVVGSLSRLLPELEHPEVPVRDDDWALRRLFAAIETTLAALASLRPFAVLVEDLHWADSGTLDLLEHALQRRAAVPLLGTFRLDDPTIRPVVAEWRVRVQRLPAVMTVELGPLSRDETADQLALLAGSVPGADLVDRVHTRSGGQPLFTEQLASGASGGEAPPGLLPSLLADLLDQRLVGLAPDAWLVVRALGVADRALTHTELRGVTGLTPEELTPALRDLDDRRLLGRSPQPHAVQVRHPLLAEAIRRRLVPGEAEEQHRRLAEVLARSEHVAPAEIARHWRGAGQAARELEWAVRAARAAESRFVGTESAAAWLRVLELWPAGQDSIGFPPVRRIEAYFAAMDGLTLTGRRTDESRALADDAMDLVDGLTDAELAELYRRRASYGYPGSHADMTAVLVLLEKSIEVYARLPPSEGLVHALDLKAGLLNFWGQHAEAMDVLVEAKEVNSRLDDSRLTRGLRASLAWQEAVSGDLRSAMRHAAEDSQVVPPTPEPEQDLWIAMRHTDIVLLAAGPAEEVARAAGRALATADAWGIETLQAAFTRANIALAWARGGQLGRAAELTDPLTDGPLTLESWPLHHFRADLDIVRGRFAEAAERLAGLTGQPYADGRPEIRESIAWLDLWQGRPQAALQTIVPTLEEPKATKTPGLTGSLLVTAARAAGDASVASSARHREQLARWLRDSHDHAVYRPFETGALPVDLAAGPTWIAELARLAGTAETGHWAAAAQAWDRVTRPFDAAYCRWRGGQVALAAGEGTVAARLLRRAARDAHEHIPLAAAIAATTA
jgi:hypothetical protein